MAEVGDVYPGTNEKIVDVVYPEGGGRILQGERGGVFTEGAAKFAGSYFDLDPAHRNDPNRRFTGIELLEGGGYRSITANPNEAGYAFRPPTATPVQQPNPAPPPPTPQQQREQFAQTPTGISAKGELVATLTQYGLPASLADQLWNDEYLNKGTPIGTITSVVLPNTQEYKTRFPGLTALQERRNRGEAVLIPSVEQYTQLEQGIGQVLKDAGLPANFYDSPDDYASFIGGVDITQKEISDRIDSARRLLYEAPVETREELARIYDLDEGEAIAYILDPTRGTQEVQKRITAAGIGGATRRTGFGLLSQQEMEQLAGSGVTEAAAAQRSAELVPQAGLFAETAGEFMTGDQLGRETEIGYLGGSATAEEAMNTRRRRRQAQFQGGGGAATGGNGQTGLG